MFQDTIGTLHISVSSWYTTHHQKQSWAHVAEIEAEKVVGSTTDIVLKRSGGTPLTLTLECKTRMKQIMVLGRLQQVISAAQVAALPTNRGETMRYLLMENL